MTVVTADALIAAQFDSCMSASMGLHVVRVKAQAAIIAMSLIRLEYRFRSSHLPPFPLKLFSGAPSPVLQTRPYSFLYPHWHLSSSPLSASHLHLQQQGQRNPCLKLVRQKPAFFSFFTHSSRTVMYVRLPIRSGSTTTRPRGTTFT